MYTRKGLIALGVMGLAASAAAFGGLDFGLFRDQQMNAHSEQLFGIVGPVEESSTESIGGVLADADPTKLVTLAKGLEAQVLSARANLGANIDMMALWPNDANPTHLIACNEQGAGDPGVQRIRLADGAVETLMSGLVSCDYGDENRPLNGNPGGAYFKFIPTTLWTGGSPITSLSQSPLVSGRVFGMRLGTRSGNTDYGQASETGLGTWIEITGASISNLRAATTSLKLTGYYRPEDIDIDAVSLADGKVRFCGNNTGNESQNNNWGQTICITDGTLTQAATPASIPEVQFFVIGSHDLAMMDNMAYQPRRGNWVIHEDGDGPEVRRNNDLWSCLEDGDDADTTACSIGPASTSTSASSTMPPATASSWISRVGGRPQGSGLGLRPGA